MALHGFKNQSSFSPSIVSHSVRVGIANHGLCVGLLQTDVHLLPRDLIPIMAESFFCEAAAAGVGTTLVPVTADAPGIRVVACAKPASSGRLVPPGDPDWDADATIWSTGERSRCPISCNCYRYCNVLDGCCF